MGQELESYYPEMHMATISSLTTSTISLEVRWNDGLTTRFPWIWLRDHDHDPDTLHPVTQQRQLYTAALPSEVVSSGASIDGDCLRISWSHGGADSVLPVPFLARYRLASPTDGAVAVRATHWDAAAIGESMPTVEYEAVMDSDDGVGRWLTTVAEYGFCIASGTPPTAEATETLLRRVGYVRETIFGGMWEFTADLTKADTAYTNLELRPHTDGTYSHDAPGVQLLHCLRFEGTGGQSTMVDGFHLAARMRKDHPDHFAVLAAVDVPGQYIGDGSHLMAARPTFRVGRSGDVVQVSFNNYDRAPFLLDEREMVDFYDALRTFERLANDSEMQWRHVLAPGQALLFDNWRVLHGRSSYTGVRQMCGGYVNREDVESRLRQLVGR